VTGRRSNQLIHFTTHPQAAWVICIASSDLDIIPPNRFRAKTDKFLEGV
jgi:hypothetical protein